MVPKTSSKSLADLWSFVDPLMWIYHPLSKVSKEDYPIRFLLLSAIPLESPEKKCVATPMVTTEEVWITNVKLKLMVSITILPIG